MPNRVKPTDSEEEEDGVSAAAAAEKEEILGGHSEREKESEQLREGERGREIGA